MSGASGFRAGMLRRFTCLPSSAVDLAMAPRGDFARGRKLEDLKEVNVRKDIDWLIIKDQGSSGACTGFATSRAVEWVRALNGQDGGREKWQQLSPWDIYARACNGIDRGASIIDCLKIAQDGISLDILVNRGIINPRAISKEAVESRKRFRVEIGARLFTYEDICWAVYEGEGVVFSVRANGGFVRIDAEGVPNYTSGVADHAVCACGELTYSKKHGWMVGADNSWSSRWGQGGRFRFTKKMFDSLTYFEAFTVKVVARDPLTGYPIMS